jgi:hypothetical protein
MLKPKAELTLPTVGLTGFEAPLSEEVCAPYWDAMPETAKLGLDPELLVQTLAGGRQSYELVTQLRGEAAERQILVARHVIQESGGGLQGVEQAAAIYILSAGSYLCHSNHTVFCSPSPRFSTGSSAWGYCSTRTWC